MEYKYNFNLLIVTKYYLWILVALLNIFDINCTGLNCEKKIISETNKCVERCPKDTYELGDYCYYQCPTNKNMENAYTNLHKSCKCKENYYLYKKERNGKNEYDCVELCPTQFYDYESKICVNDCGNKLTHIDRDNMGNEKQKRCSNKCLPTEFLKKDENACLDTCDYYLKEKDSKICMDKCDDGYIFSRPDAKGGRECVLQCDQDDVIAFVSIHPAEKKRKQCLSRKEVAQFYKYNNIYFENCKDTYEIFSINTFQYKNNISNEQICIDSCSKTDKQFISSENECIDNCGQDFYYNKYCLKECFRHNYNMDYSSYDKNKNVINESIGNKNIKDEDTIDFNQFPKEKECLERCPFGTLTDEDEKKCYVSTCPEGKFINSNLECIQECESGVIEQNAILKIIKKIGETPDETFHTITKKFCLSSCPDNSPYYYNNKCYNVSCKEMNKYSNYDYPFICYDSCTEAKGYNDENGKDFTCHKTQLRKLEDVQCEKYYTFDSNKKKKCLTQTECFNRNNYKYLNGYECTNECTGYIIENTENRPYDCYEYLTDCINNNKHMIVHVNEGGKNLKYCRTECNQKYQIDKYYSSVTNKEAHYCSNTCPADYKYINGNKCAQSCDNYYDGNTCTDKCTGKYRFVDAKECVNNCIKNGQTFYILGEFKSNDENICQYSCSGTYLYISNNNEANKNAYNCAQNCGDKYYYEDKKICLDSCDLHESETSKKCVYSCVNNKKAIKKDGDNYYYCNTCNSFIEKQIISSSLPLMEVCVSQCTSSQYPLYSQSTKYCLTECPLDESYNYNNVCYNKCPTEKYVDELDKKCKDSNCPNNTRLYYEEIDGLKICRQNCPGDRFIENLGNSNPKGICLKSCPSGKNYIQNKNNCTNGCPSTLYPVEIIKTPYSIYNCSENCGDKFTIYGKKECVDACGAGYYESPDRICYEDNCKLNTEYPFTTVNSNNKNVCAKRCDNSQPYYVKDEKICKTSCDGAKSIYDYDNECVDKCEKSNYLIYNDEGGKTKCVAACPESKKYYEVDKQCVNTCPETHKYVKDNKCVTQSEFSCQPNQFIKTNEVTNEVECVLKCDDDQFYYEDQRICIPDCLNKTHYKIQGTQICITQEECPNPYYSYYADGKEGQIYDNNMCLLKCPTDKPYTDNRKCVVNCPQAGNYLHIYGELDCIPQCPSGTVKNDDICTSVCPGDKVLDYLGKDCIEKCDENHPYHVVGVNQCIKACPKGYLSEDDKCVTSCNEANYLVNNTSCKNSCEGEKNFVLNKICYEKCPTDFRIFKIVKIDEETTIKNCLKECGDHLFPNGECKSECDEEYPYYNYDNGTCLKQCPYFYVEDETDAKEKKKCYKQCPSTHSFYTKGSPYPIKCKDSCDPEEYKNITDNECQVNCELKTFIDKEDNNKKYCLNDCDDLGLLKNGNQCIRSCKELDDDYIFNPEKGTCECPNLFYYDETEVGKKKCLASNINECSQNTENEYIIRKNGEKECLKNCKNHILSFDEKICYYDDVKSFKCPLVTQSVKSYEDKNKAEYKCDCPSKFYKGKDADENEIKVCLSENEECPTDYKFYNPEGNECVSSCGSNYCEVGNLCILKGTVTNCNDQKWNKIDEKTYERADNGCEISKNYYPSHGTNICLKSCQNSTNFIFHDNECISNCKDVQYSELYKIPSSSLGSNPPSLYKCRCVNLWHINNGKVECIDPETEECNIEGKTKKIVDTNECVGSCDLEFNDGECFANCDEVKKYYPGFEYEKVDNKCRCKGLWMKNNDNKIECIKGDICPKERRFKDIETNECTETQICNDKTFNNLCYKKCEEADNLQDDTDNASTCKCKYRWYKYNNEFLEIEDYKVCLGKDDDCPDEYPYKHPEGECLKSLKECDYIFNNECVGSCPESTKNEKEGDGASTKPITCVCDPKKGKWHLSNKENGKAILECGLLNCPSNKPLNDEITNECLISCPADKVIYNNICYESCPGKTKVLDQISKICEDILIFDKEEEMKTLVDLQEKVSETIQDLYKKKPSVGLVYNIANSTMQFYGVNKNKETNKDLIMRSNLTYIDISKCLGKLYENYLNTPETEGDIIIEKYDIGDVTNSTTINPVEYHLINSKTGQPIPMDVCEDNSILISYPLSSILNNFPTRNKKTRKLQESDEEDALSLNFREKFLLGKELYLQDNEIDIFNYENKIYHDMCYPLEINIPFSHFVKATANTTTPILF